MEQMNYTLDLWSCQDLIIIVEKSLFLHERFAPQFSPRNPPPPDEVIPECINRWCQRLADGDHDRFWKRFEWDGLSVEQVTQALGGVQLNNLAMLPSWSHLIEQFVENLCAWSRQSAETHETFVRLPVSASSLPFIELMSGFLICAVERLQERTGSTWNSLAPVAKNSLQHQLLARLCFTAQETLMIEFDFDRSAQRADLLFNEDQSITDGRRLYQTFVVKMLKGGLLNIFREYPVLARLLAQITLQWVDSTSEFLERLDTDIPEIIASLAGGRPVGRVSNIVAGLSDPHNRGRSVLRVEFDSGFSCMYKPSNLDCNESYNRLLTWFNLHDAPHLFCVFKGIYRPDYGWVEIVRPMSCSNVEMVERFYTRVGTLLCLIFILDGCDCHAGNLVSHGEFPVLIDTETLLQPGIAASDLGEVLNATLMAGRKLFSESVFQVGMLPYWISRKGLSHSAGGLTIGRPVQSKVRVRSLKNVNTDTMAWQTIDVPVKDDTCNCILGEQVVDSQGYVDQIVEGFEDMYNYLRSNADAILDPAAGCLLYLESSSPRFLFRNTRHYAELQKASLRPSLMRNGLDVNIRLDALYRRFLRCDKRPPVWGIIRAEQDALLEGDIPLFLSRASDGVLKTGDGTTIPDVRLPSALAAVRSHLSNLSQTELHLQSAFIRSAFQQIPDDEFSSPTPCVEEMQVTEPLSTAEFISEALRIAQRIRSVAITVNDTATWITRAYDSDAQVWQIHPMTPPLYDGVCGPALFLSAMECAVPGSGFRGLALSAFKTVLDCGNHRFTRQSGDEFGTSLDIASVVYSLTTAGQLLGVEGLIDGAEAFAQKISVRHIQSDSCFDLLRGSAGVFLCLHTLHRIRPRNWILDLMVACGTRLLEGQKAGPQGGAAWETINGKMLCGFSHGAAGIAFALQQLAVLTGNTQYSEASHSAEQYENALFSEENGNWPDLRAEGASQVRYCNAWCHGAAGIVLGRLHQTNSDALNRCTEIGLRTVMNEPLGSLDHLCCGNLGRTDTLLYAGLRLNRPDLMFKSKMLATQVVSRARQTNDYRLGVPRAMEMASFHQGLSGIGYQLLRLALPLRIPSVLAWS